MANVEHVIQVSDLDIAFFPPLKYTIRIVEQWMALECHALTQDVFAYTFRLLHSLVFGLFCESACLASD